jgi:hypothetical protein
VSDLIFFALYIGVARALGLRSAATVVGVALGIAVAVVAGMRVSAMPALPWMAAAFLGVNADLLFSRRRNERSRHHEVSPRRAPGGTQRREPLGSRAPELGGRAQSEVPRSER